MRLKGALAIKKIIISLLSVVALFIIARQSSWAAEREEVFRFAPFEWQGQSISRLVQLYQSMRKVNDPETAEALRCAMATTNQNPNFFLGYALGEFELKDEQIKAEMLFQVEHPIAGSVQEVRSLSMPAYLILGMLTGNGYSKQDLAIVRKELIKLTENSTAVVFSELYKIKGNITLDSMLKLIQSEIASCVDALKKPSPDDKKKLH